MISSVERMLLLKAHPAFDRLGLDRIASIARRLVPALLPALTRWDGDAPEMGAMIVASGRVVVETAGGGRRCYEAGDVAGLLEMLASGAVPYEFACEEEAEVLTMSSDTLGDLCEEDFDVVECLLRWVAITALQNIAGLVSGARLDEAPPAPEPKRGPRGGTALARRIDVLAATRAFPAGQMDALTEIAQQAKDASLAEGTVIWSAGEESDSFLLLIDGAVRCETAAGWHVHSGPDALVGDLDALGGLPRSYAATAVGPVSAVVFRVDPFLDVLEDHPQMAIGFLALQAARTLAAAPSITHPGRFNAD